MELLKNTIAILVLVLTSNVSASLIINGSFEDGSFAPNTSAGDMNLLNGSNTMNGWTVVNDLTWIDNSNPWNLTASNGSKFLDLTEYQSTSGFGGVSQMINTIINEEYSLSFDIGSSVSFGALSSIRASAGSTFSDFTSTNVSEDDVWESYSLNFIATSAFTEIKLEGLAAGRAYIGLDNISVSARVSERRVPEPATLALMGLGLAGIGYRRRNAK